MADKDLKDEEELDTEAEESDEVDEEAEASGADDEADERLSEPPESSDEEDEEYDAEKAAAEIRAAERAAQGEEPEEQAAPERDGETPAHVGAATKYVHAAFFGAGILVAYLSGKILLTVWNEVAEMSFAVEKAPFLLRYSEEDRESYTLIAGALIGVIAVIQTYRRDKIRGWAGEVAGELAKVTWPNKDTVTNGTIVVVIASLIATTYIGLLDRLWAFLTNLVYGA